jgi:hypothetical protein
MVMVSFRLLAASEITRKRASAEEVIHISFRIFGRMAADTLRC